VIDPHATPLPGLFGGARGALIVAKVERFVCPIAVPPNVKAVVEFCMDLKPPAATPVDIVLVFRLKIYNICVVPVGFSALYTPRLLTVSVQAVRLFPPAVGVTPTVE
jgi:hypothetical protein